MSNIYQDGTYLRNNPSWHEEDAAWKAHKIRDLLARNDIDAASVCEVGCGTGEVISVLSQILPESDATEYLGIDISEQAIDLSLAKQKKNLHFKHADIASYESGSFDLALAIDVFEHIEDYFSFLRIIKQLSKYKVFHIPLDLSVQTVLRAKPIIAGRESVGHIHYFTKETALASLRDTGHEVVDMFYTRDSLELPNRGLKANLLKIPRKLALAVNEDLAVRILGGCSLMVLTT